MKTRSKIYSVLVVAFIGALLIRTFVVEGFIVVGDSMEPTIKSGEFVLINKLSYINSEPTRGEIVVAKSREMRQKLVKRIVGMPGERFSIEEGKIVLRANRLDEGNVLSESYLKNVQTYSTGITLIKLDPKEYFAMGDNRSVSIDSRELGPIDIWDIKGRVIGVFNIERFIFRKF